MSYSGLRLRSGRVIGLAPPPAPAAPPLPIPPGPLPPGLPAPNTLHGLPRALRMAILEALFQGQPKVQVERRTRPAVLGRLCLVSRMIKDEATEAYVRVTPFQVTIVSAHPDFEFYNRLIYWGQAQPPPVLAGAFVYTMAEFRQRVRSARPLIPSQRSRSWGAQGRIRVARTAGEFPWNTCPQWLKDAGPFIRDIQFDIVWPMPGYPPWELPGRSRNLLWGHLVSGTHILRVVPPGGGLTTQTVMAQQQGVIMPLGSGLGGVIYGIPDPARPLDPNPYLGQCTRALIEAIRLRQSYLPAAPPPGTPGFTGYSLRDLRSIAKAFSEPSIYVIQD